MHTYFFLCVCRWSEHLCWQIKWEKVAQWLCLVESVQARGAFMGLSMGEGGSGFWMWPISNRSSTVGRQMEVYSRTVVDCFCSFECCFRGGLAGILNVRPWLAPSWGSPWTSTVGGLISGSPITTTSWLSLRYRSEVFHCQLLEILALVLSFGYFNQPQFETWCTENIQRWWTDLQRLLFMFLTGFLWEWLLGQILPAHRTPDDRRLQDVKVSEEFHHH